MKVSVSITNYSWPAPLASRLAELAAIVDESWIDTLFVADHLLQADPTASVEQEMLEAYTTSSFLAAHTGRVRLGTMVSAASYRAPSLLIKTVTTLDVLSGGPRLARVKLEDLIFSEKFGRKSFNIDVEERAPVMDALYDGQHQERDSGKEGCL